MNGSKALSYAYTVSGKVNSIEDISGRKKFVVMMGFENLSK